MNEIYDKIMTLRHILNQGNIRISEKYHVNFTKKDAQTIASENNREYKDLLGRNFCGLVIKSIDADVTYVERNI